MIEKIIIVAAINGLAAFTQASTGFGYAIVAMFLIPIILPYEQGLVISAAIIVVIAVQMVYTLRHHIRPKKIIWPLFGCLLMFGVGRYLISILDTLVVSKIMGVFLIILSVFFYVTKKRNIIISETRKNGLLIGFITGLTTGMFNIVGPFLSLYYYDNAETTLEFKANLESSFLVAGVISLIINLSISCEDLFIVGAIGLSAVVSVMAGILGLKLYSLLNKEKLKWVIIIALPIMGIVQLIKG